MAPSIIHVLYNMYIKYCLNAVINTANNDKSDTFNKSELDSASVTPAINEVMCKSGGSSPK